MTSWKDERPEPGAAPSWRVTYPEPLGMFLDEPIHDDLMQITMQLAAELWVVKRRLNLLEGRLESSPDAGGAESEVRDESFSFDPSDRDLFVQRIFGHLLMRTEADAKSS